jgi:hypothetical protein|tara:strand:+ start:290 stop:442 length:153 start_codon:yes stop_codon:yes gene_type:complete
MPLELFFFVELLAALLAHFAKVLVLFFLLFFFVLFLTLRHKMPFLLTMIT